jgi:hypothetical protein
MTATILELDRAFIDYRSSLQRLDRYRRMNIDNATDG